jgi:hypothetical protein
LFGRVGDGDLVAAGEFLPSVSHSTRVMVDERC